MEIQIREYTPNDKAGCTEAFKSNVPQYFTEEEIGDFEAFLNRIEAQQAKGAGPRKTYFYVVLLDGKIIGSGGFGDKDGTNVISLAWGFIHKDFHKKGLGAQLLKFRLNEIKRLYPACPVVLDTTQHSYPFFERNGFATTKITNDFYAQGMHRYDMVLQ